MPETIDRRDKTEHKNRKPRYFAYFTMLIFVGSIFGYALLSSGRTSGGDVHRHATLYIQGVDVKSLPTAEDLEVGHSLHLHKADVDPILHMEGQPAQLISFFASINFDITKYKIEVNGMERDFLYVFNDGDRITLWVR